MTSSLTQISRLAAALGLVAIASLLISAAPPQRTAARQRPAHTAPAATAVTASFRDVTRASGIDFHMTCGGKEKLYIMESMCGGVAVFDYDNDGWMDILMIDGTTLPDMRSGKCHLPKLYRNHHDGTFSDVSAKAAMKHCGWGFGVAIGDYDNDGWNDVYITYLDGGALYHNDQDGTFTDVTAKAGIGNDGRWGTSTAFGDYDNDGNLDLYVVNYVDLNLAHLPEFGKGPFCQYRGIPVSCGPRGLKGSRDRLYRNNGDGTFTDVSEKLDIDPQGYYGLGVLWLDYDKDGCLDVYVADDSTPSLLYHNNCRGGFTEVGASAGVAYSADGREQAGMGVDASDFNRDGWPDIAKTNFSDDTNDLYRNDQDGQFTDVAGPSGFGPVSVPFLGFGVKFFDFDNDSWPDLIVANGHVNPQVDGHSFGVTYAERALLFHNSGDGTFQEIAKSAGADLEKARVARGLALGDFSNSGRLDLLMSVLDGSPVLLRNETRSQGHSIAIKLIGSSSNRNGFGARVEINSGGIVQTDEVRANSSFESASDSRLHFGLGGHNRVDSITIRWPSGKLDKVQHERADQELIITEGKGVVDRSPFRPRTRAPIPARKRPSGTP